MPWIIDERPDQFRRPPGAAATLRSIAELSKQTQVLLSTHHRHLVELRMEAVASELVTHELGALRGCCLLDDWCSIKRSVRAQEQTCLEFQSFMASRFTCIIVMTHCLMFMRFMASSRLR